MLTAMSSSSSGRAGTAGPSEGRKVAFIRSSSSRPAASAGTPAVTSNAYVGHTRRHSLFGTEDRVVLDIGSKYAKFGFSGEPRPRAVVSSVSVSQPSTSFLRFGPNEAPQDCLWDLDLQRCPNDVQRRDREALLLAQLTQLVQTAFSEYLMVDSRQRKVFVVENPLMPTLVKDMLCRILFDNLQVPSVSFLPAPLLSLVAVGKLTGLVVDIGYLETTVTPVYCGRPLLSNVASSPRAGRRLNQRLKALLLRFARYIEAQRSLQTSDTSLRQRSKAVEELMLTDDVLEEIKAKALFVSFSSSASQTAAEVDLIETRRRQYAHESKATPFTFAISPDTVDPNNAASLIQRFEPSAQSNLSATGNSTVPFPRGVIAIPGWLRERAAELLFESEDPDEDDVVQLKLRVLSSLPLDLRRPMCENVLVTGGSAMLPGFANRVRTQLTSAVKQAELPGGPLSVSSLIPQSHHETSSLGQAPLHQAICVLNDPWPDAKAGSGSAPAFAASLLSWIGASLTGALKTSALAEISREAYDQALASALAGKPHKSTVVASTAGATSSQRPTVRGSNRGSFVGVVGGLETGAFGGLSAVSRHLVGVGARPDPISPKRAAEAHTSTVTSE